jgi:transporter family-2 protein
MPFQNLVLTAVAFVAGCALPLQAAVNSALARGVGSPLTATAVSFTVGTIILVSAVLLTRQPLPTAELIGSMPGYSFIAGGLLGSFFLFSAIFLTPRLGVAVVMSTVIAGQLIAAVMLDKYGVLGLAVREATPGRLLGVVVMIAGVVMIRLL